MNFIFSKTRYSKSLNLNDNILQNIQKQNNMILEMNQRIIELEKNLNEYLNMM